MQTDDTGRLLYSTPVFHGLCSEDGRCSWDYFVHHYSDPDREKRDNATRRSFLTVAAYQAYCTAPVAA